MNPFRETIAMIRKSACFFAFLAVAFAWAVGHWLPLLLLIPGLFLLIWSFMIRPKVCSFCGVMLHPEARRCKICGTVP